MEIAEISISCGQKAIIDREDLQLVSQFKWFAMWKPQTRSYVAITSKGILMHRMVMNAVRGEQIDHINHDTLDNRQCNLRRVTNGQNRMNARKGVGGRKTSSAFKGVSFNAMRKKWVCSISKDKKRFLSFYETEMEAALAYDAAAIQLHGEFALTNSSLGLLGR